MGVVGIGLDTNLSDQSPQLSGGHPTGGFEDPIDHFPGGYLCQVGGSLDDNPGSSQIDPPRSQRFPHLRQPLFQINCQVQVGCGRPAGQTQRRSDLSRRRLVGDLRIGIDLVHQLGDRSHVLEYPRLEMRSQPLMGLQHHNPVVTGQTLILDAGHHGGQSQSWFQCVDPRRQRSHPTPQSSNVCLQYDSQVRQETPR